MDLASSSTIAVTVPASLRFRDLAVRTLTAAAHLIGLDDNNVVNQDTTTLDLQRSFDGEFISAFSEIFNNICIHAYQGNESGEISLTIEPSDDKLVLTIEDMGKSFDIDSVPKPELDSLPEGGMGIHIARSCLDGLDYIPGSPNRWQLTKYISDKRKQ